MDVLADPILYYILRSTEVPVVDDMPLRDMLSWPCVIRIRKEGILRPIYYFDAPKGQLGFLRPVSARESSFEGVSESLRLVKRGALAASFFLIKEGKDMAKAKHSLLGHVNVEFSDGRTAKIVRKGILKSRYVFKTSFGQDIFSFSLPPGLSGQSECTLNPIPTLKVEELFYMLLLSFYVVVSIGRQVG